MQNDVKKLYPNLIPNSERTKEELQEITKKGGIASGVARRKKKLLKETIMEFLEAQNPETGNIFQVDMVNKMIEKVLKDGDVQAFNSLRDTSGQKPKEEVQAVVMPLVNIKGL